MAIDDVSVTSGKEAALVTTRVGLHDGNVIRNLVQLVRRSSRWQVVVYTLAPASS